MAIWAKRYWKTILKIWKKSGGKPPATWKSPSQPTLSRFLCDFDSEILRRTSNEYRHKNISDELKGFKKIESNNHQNRKKNRNGKGPKNRSCLKIPHYSLDGKSRKGCTSENTGRTEIDLTLYSSDFKTVINQLTLKDKQGEQTGVVQIFADKALVLPRGVITADAGILCPAVTNELTKANQYYLMQIKGNAGEAFEDALNIPWDRVKLSDTKVNVGNGRIHIRSIKQFDINFLKESELEKYSEITSIFEIDSWVYNLKEKAVTQEFRYFVSSLPGTYCKKEVLTFIRSHWKHESYHWIKDAVLKEDDSTQKSSNGSRLLSIINSAVIDIGLEVNGSVKNFTKCFATDTEKMMKTM